MPDELKKTDDNSLFDISVSKNSITDSVAQQIKDLIINKKLSPGQKLPSQRKLAEQLNVGRPTIREALTKLETIGLVKVRHGRNTTVERLGLDSLLTNISPALELTETDVLNLLESKEIIETKCAELAAERITADELDEMLKHYKAMEKYSDDPAKYAQEDYLFHYTIVKSVKNPMIKEIMKIIGRMILKAIEKTALLPGRNKAMEYHKKILEAIENGDGEEARSLVHEHLQDTIKRYTNTD